MVIVNTLFFIAAFYPWGKDADLANKSKKKEAEPKWSFSNRAIRFYQNYISPIDGPRSSYRPSSSEYTRQAILKYGIYGYFLGCDRLMRENSETWIYKLEEWELGVRKLDPIPIAALPFAKGNNTK